MSEEYRQVSGIHKIHSKLFLCTSVEYSPSHACGGRTGCQTFPSKIIVNLTELKSVFFQMQEVNFQEGLNRK